MARNQYAWMGRRRKDGYAPNAQRHRTMFDDWLFSANINIRQASEIMDIPEMRCRHMQKGRTGIRAGTLVDPCLITRYAMTAIFVGLAPSRLTMDCYEMRDRLADAAIEAGFAPWGFDAARQADIEAAREASQAKAVGRLAA